MSEEFLTHLCDQVEGLQKRWGLAEGPAFLMWYATEALDLPEDVAYEAVSYDGGNDKDVDLFHLDEQHERILIAQGKFNRKGGYKANKNELLGLLHTTDWLGNREALVREGRQELVAAADDYMEGLSRGYSVEYQYVYAGPPHKDTLDQAELFNARALDEHPSSHATVIDLPLLEAIHREAAGEDTRIPEATIKLKREQFFPQEGSYGQAVVATLPAEELCRLRSDHGDELFARNVRLFLGTRIGGVNAGIRDTLSSGDRTNFWAYNNGVTFVCDSFKLDSDQATLRLSNFSIVNGCQTTVSLGNAASASADAEVLARFIAAPPRLIDSIIFYTNSQTPIRGWELRSQDRLQKRLQSEMTDEPNRYYYALRRGEVRTLNPDERAKFTRDGRFHVIPHDMLAQFLAAFHGLPYVAYKDKGKIFSVHYEAVFPPDLRVEEALLTWRASEAADRVVSEALKRALDQGEELDSVILKRGGKLFTVAVISQMLSLRNGPNFINKLEREVVTSKATLDRLATYANVAVVWYVRATRQMVGEQGLQRLSAVLRTQDTYPQLRKAIDEEWRVQSIDQSWVKSLPQI